MAFATVPHWIRTPDGIAFSDIPTRAGGRLPGFLVIGAAKAGTTSIYQYLNQHSQIHMCPVKEPHFFSTDLIYEYGLDWYKGLFADASTDQLCGEASTTYAMWPTVLSAPQRIHQVIPDVKLIYVVREPVARIESECLQFLKRSRYALKDDSLPLSVDALLEFKADAKSGSSHPIRNSEYIRQINHYLRFFDRHQLLVIFHEDLHQRPKQTMTRILNFLEVDSDVEIDTTQRHNVTQAFVNGLKDEKAASSWRKIPGYAWGKRLVPDSLKNNLKRVATSRMPEKRLLEPMSDGVRDRLTAHFKPFNDELADFLGTDLPFRP